MTKCQVVTTHPQSSSDFSRLGLSHSCNSSLSSCYRSFTPNIGHALRAVYTIDIFLVLQGTSCIRRGGGSYSDSLTADGDEPAESGRARSTDPSLSVRISNASETVALDRSKEIITCSNLQKVQVCSLMGFFRIRVSSKGGLFRKHVS